MALPVINNWREFFNNYDEGLGSSYERVVINDLLAKICEKYGIRKVLEAPCFGFTGVSGVNSMDMAGKGLDVTVIDHNGERLGLIEEVWKECQMDVKTVFSDKYECLNFADNNFDLTWNRG
jgi:ubiquinone/menaquinone biosynthesis C-methylase UbiE